MATKLHCDECDAEIQDTGNKPSENTPALSVFIDGAPLVLLNDLCDACREKNKKDILKSTTKRKYRRGQSSCVGEFSSGMDIGD